MEWRPFALTLFFATSVSVVACQPGGEAPPVARLEPGAGAWNSGNVSCESDADCGQGETCAQKVCQMKRCGDPNYKSVSPLGATGYFKRDRELVVLTDDSSLQAYDSTDNTLVRPKPSSWPVEGSVVDVAGGNVLGTRPEALVVATPQSVTVKGPAGPVSLPVRLSPVAVATGDINGDGRDEIVAVDSSGSFVVCDAKEAKCTPSELGIPGVVDVAVGDVDGDGYGEPIFLVGDNLAVYNFDAEKTGQKKVLSLSLEGKKITRIAVGDLDADGTEEIVGLEDGGGWFWDHDNLHVFGLKETTLTVRGTTKVAKGAADLAIGPIGGNRNQVALLNEDHSIEVFSLGGDSLVSENRTKLTSGTHSTRIAIADVDGDSPARRLIGTPKLVPGRVVPITVLTLPPYSRTHSTGTSSVSVGSEKETNESHSTSISLSASLGLTLGGELGPVVTAEVTGTLGQENSRTKETTKTVTIGASFNVEAHPDSDGYDSGAVMLACGCYHQYTYAIDDPGKVLGQDKSGKTIDVFVPVGGQTQLWSTRRYNALAAALPGRFPQIKIPMQMGQVESYPSQPLTLDGKVIPREDLVFTDPPTFRASDVAEVNFDLEAGKTTTNSVATTNTAGVSATVGAFGVSVTGELELSVSHGYDLSVGKTAIFSGTIPPLKNDQNTPEDEFAIYGYSFTPIVYREHFVDEGKTKSAYYVLTYAVGH